MAGESRKEFEADRFGPAGPFKAEPSDQTVNEAVQQWLDQQSTLELERVLGELRNYTWCDATGAIARIESELAKRGGRLM